MKKYTQSQKISVISLWNYDLRIIWKCQIRSDHFFKMRSDLRSSFDQMILIWSKIMEKVIWQYSDFFRGNKYIFLWKRKELRQSTSSPLSSKFLQLYHSRYGRNKVDMSSRNLPTVFVKRGTYIRPDLDFSITVKPENILTQIIILIEN